MTASPSRAPEVKDKGSGDLAEQDAALMTNAARSRWRSRRIGDGQNDGVDLESTPVGDGMNIAQTVFSSDRQRKDRCTER
jgi:hypothetical protein